MATDKEKIVRAQELAKSKKYKEAIALLKTVKHPKRDEWIAQITMRMAASGKSSDNQIKTAKSSRRSPMLMVLLLFILIFGIGAAAFFFLNNQNSTTPSLPFAAQNAGSGAQNLREMAAYLPADIDQYMVIRTDDAFIQELDGIIARFISTARTATNAPIADPYQPDSIMDILNQTTNQAEMGDFATAVRSWLGNYIGTGIISASFSPEGEATDAGQNFYIVDITDRAKAMEFLKKTNVSTDEGYEQSEINGFTVLKRENSFGVPDIFMINDDVIIFTNREVSAEAMPNANPLKDDAAFNATLDMFPAENYSALIYTNYARMIGKGSSAIERSLQNSLPNTQNILPLLPSAANLTGQQAFGFTILDNRAFIVDAVWNIGDTAPFTEKGFSFQGTGSVKPEFLAHIPTDAAFVIQGTNIKALYDLTLTNIKAGAQVAGENASWIDRDLERIENDPAILGGLKLQEDILSWLTGDYALFATYSITPEMDLSPIFNAILPDENLPPTPPNLTTLENYLSYGVLIEATDAAKAQKIVDTLANIAENVSGGADGMTFTREQIQNANALVLTENSTGFKLVLAANDRVLVLGSPKAVETALAGSGGFNASPAYTEAMRYGLSNPTLFGYAGRSGLHMLIDPIIFSTPSMTAIFAEVVAGLSEEPVTVDTPTLDEMRAGTQTDLARWRQITALFSHAVITTTAAENGDSFMRFAFVLSQ